MVAEAVLVVVVVGLWVVFVFVFLVDGGMRMWVWVCDFGGWGLWWLLAGGFYFLWWWWLAVASHGCGCDWGLLGLKGKWWVSSGKEKDTVVK